MSAAPTGGLRVRNLTKHFKLGGCLSGLLEPSERLPRILLPKVTSRGQRSLHFAGIIRFGTGNGDF